MMTPFAFKGAIWRFSGRIVPGGTVIFLHPEGRGKGKGFTQPLPGESYPFPWTSVEIKAGGRGSMNAKDKVKKV